MLLQDVVSYENGRETFANQDIHLTWEEEEENEVLAITDVGTDSHVLAIEDIEGNEVVENDNNREIVLQSTQDITGNTSLPQVHPLDLIRFNFIGKHNGLGQKATVKD